MEHEGVALAEAHVPALEVLYRRVGEDRVRQHGLDSSVNGLPYDRHGEELAVHEFANLIRPGMHQFLQQPVSLQLPCWSRLLSCSASLRDDLALAGSQGRQTRLVNVPLAPKPKMEVGRVQPAPWHQPAASGSAR
jgi:glucosyl-3-phosphoglycerate synthase